MAFGLKPSRRTGSASNSLGLSKYRVANSYATALFAGDPVTISGGTVVRAVNGDQVIGVVEAFQYIDATGRPVFTTYLPASTSSTGLVEGDARPLALVNDDPNATFIAAAASALVVSAGMTGLLFTVSVGAGSTYTKQSGAVVNAAVTSLDQSMVRVIGLYDIPGNVYDVSGSIVEVTFTNHAFKVSR